MTGLTEDQLALVVACLQGRGSMDQAARAAGVNKRTLQRHAAKHRELFANARAVARGGTPVAHTLRHPNSAKIDDIIEAEPVAAPSPKPPAPARVVKPRPTTAVVLAEVVARAPPPDVEQDEGLHVPGVPHRLTVDALRALLWRKLNNTKTHPMVWCKAADKLTEIMITGPRTSRTVAQLGHIVAGQSGVVRQRGVQAETILTARKGLIGRDPRLPAHPKPAPSRPRSGDASTQD